jgi:hypothetical protein
VTSTNATVSGSRLDIAETTAMTATAPNVAVTSALLQLNGLVWPNAAGTLGYVLTQAANKVLVFSPLPPPNSYKRRAVAVSSTNFKFTMSPDDDILALVYSSTTAYKVTVEITLPPISSLVASGIYNKYTISNESFSDISSKTTVIIHPSSGDSINTIFETLLLPVAYKTNALRICLYHDDSHGWFTLLP